MLMSSLFCVWFGFRKLKWLRVGLRCALQKNRGVLIVLKSHPGPGADKGFPEPCLAFWQQATIELRKTGLCTGKTPCPESTVPWLWTGIPGTETLPRFCVVKPVKLPNRHALKPPTLVITGTRSVDRPTDAHTDTRSKGASRDALTGRYKKNRKVLILLKSDLGPTTDKGFTSRTRFSDSNSPLKWERLALVQPSRRAMIAPCHDFAWSYLAICHRVATPRLCKVIAVSLQNFRAKTPPTDGQTDTYTQTNTHTRTMPHAQ